MLAHILDHAVVFEQYDVDLAPKDEVGIFDFANGNHVSIVDNRLHAVSAYLDDAAIGVDEWDVDAADDQVVGKHAVTPQVAGCDVEPVYLGAIAHLGYDGSRGEGEGAYVVVHVVGCRAGRGVHGAVARAEPLLRDAQFDYDFVDERVADG